MLSFSEAHSDHNIHPTVIITSFLDPLSSTTNEIMAKSPVVGKVDRSESIVTSITAHFSQRDLMGKIQMVTSLVTCMVFVMIPMKIMEVIRGDEKPNMGRLKTIIPDHIYQQTYGGGITNSTILLSRNKDAILIHIVPNLTSEFLDDLETKLYKAPVKYIVISNEAHETFAFQAKARWPDAVVLCPKPSKAAVEMAVKVDAVLEDCMETLEKEFGIVKMFSQFDDCVSTHAERSFVIDLYNNGGKCLFVGQCGYCNMTDFSPLLWLTGFQGLRVRGRLIRQFYWLFVQPNKQGHVNTYWKYIVNSMPEWKAAVFTHGSPIVATTGSTVTVKDQLLQFYVY